MIKAWLRGIIHCHSHYSHDSVMSIGAYIRAARRCKLDFIILTDHDSTGGSRELKAAAARQMPELSVPIAAEYLTDEGDVIAAFLEEDVRARRFQEFVSEARDNGALLMLPHPYLGHREPERIARAADLIEVVNCRARRAQNARAEALARALSKRGYAGSDAHFSRSLGNVIVEVEDCGSLRESLLAGEIRWTEPVFTSRWEYGASQAVKSWKRRDARLALRLARGACARLLAAKRAAAPL